MTAPRSGGGLDPPGEHLQAVQGDEGLHRAREAPALDPDRPLAVQELLRQGLEHPQGLEAGVLVVGGVLQLQV